jgi:hypothetical protein
MRDDKAVGRKPSNSAAPLSRKFSRPLFARAALMLARCISTTAQKNRANLSLREGPSAGPTPLERDYESPRDSQAHTAGIH